ncbi:MAG: 5-formyltetrahydrofolate cyclo-ligase [Aquificaceae bacterium]|nr:5-formyltetrahydrofolate cyclo-ligase [Aquificaceae bacterium]MCX8059896.1 5-formyltetrahydrofolate cyclo-ligase [Aquificaceae bacterium]MDW8097459.1 5-formyltetrahydrofolate cyclo-ligase [Aquificaceae bacterium]
MTLKKELRRCFIKEREALPPERRRELSLRIVEKVLQLPQLREAKSVLLFYPHRGEPDIRPLFSWVLGEGKELLLPRVSGQELKLLKVQDPQELLPGAYGILEPPGGEEVKPEEVHFSLIPGLLFDRAGHRVGYGKGYYDRLMGKLGGTKVGVCYHFQVLDKVPTDPWDVPVNLVITEKNTYKGGER